MSQTLMTADEIATKVEQDVAEYIVLLTEATANDLTFNDEKRSRYIEKHRELRTQIYENENARINAIEVAKIDEQQNGYKRKRAAEYPDFRNYLDGIVKGDQAQIQAYIDACLAVKAKYPKPKP